MAKLIRKATNQISTEYTAAERRAITRDVVDFIRKRTDSGKDKNNESFAGYSKEYKTSNTFKEAGKSGKVNLQLSKVMMSQLDTLPSKKGEITYGYEKGSDQIGKATGNILGTYGQKSPIKGKARDFLGITQSDLNTILSRYPTEPENRDESKARAALVNAITTLSKKEAKLKAASMVNAGLLLREEADEILDERL